MDKELQVKLLRFLQTEKFRPVGSDLETSVDVRIVCATNKNPMEEVIAGRFREDLYYRLHVISITLPPLRDRNKDVQLIADKLLHRYSEQEDNNFKGFDRASLKILHNYEWPGNVREMQNVIRQIVVLNAGPEVTVAMLPPVLRGVKTNNTVPLFRETVSRPESVNPLWKVEELHISDVLELCKGNIPKAAALLEVSPSTLYRKLKITGAK
jgi:two-component system repressor protein LuxO